MTEEQEKTLKKYARQITTAYFANYYVGLAPDDIRQIISLHNEFFPHQREQYTTCNACVLKVLKKLYKYLELTKEEAEKTDTNTEEHTKEEAETEPINEPKLLEWLQFKKVSSAPQTLVILRDNEPNGEYVNGDVNEYVNGDINDSEQAKEEEAEKTDSTEEQQTAEAPKTKAKRQPRKTSKKK